MNVTRKDFLKKVGALSILVPQLGIAEPFAAGSLPDLAKGNLPGADELWGWLEQLAAWCPAATGSAGHNAFVNFLDQRLRAVNITPQRKTFKIDYWEPKSWTLTAGGEKIHVTGYRPYSGPTSPEGVTAALYYAGMAPNLDYSGASGKIVLIEMAPAPTQEEMHIAGQMVGSYPANATVPGTAYGPVGAFRTVPDLKLAQQAGAVGVVYIWNRVSDGNAEDQAAPFTAPPNPVPAIWVGQTTGSKLKSMAASQASATLTMHAIVHPACPTDNIWAVLPGKTDEAVIINTHTDGCNALEENGALGVVALANYSAKLPQSQRNRTLIFLMTTGHFAHGMVRGTQDWINSNPDWMKKAVACVTIEHLGATEWVDHPAANEYKSTGKLEWGLAYTPRIPEAELFLKAAQGTEARNIFAFKPEGSYPGEGAAFYRAGIPTISYIPTPQYLFVEPVKGGAIDKLDKHRLHGEVVTLARCVAALDKMTVEEIRGTDGARA
ncbi:MAG TPA: hypothetical protein VKU01_31030 [Bryobacteraceae bacterium]|nr:hypothetical protein [Bryobacteraceae bacterium]